jgi:mRNA-degrading endonuclease HigB of HigAB toxin-antitoxin module
MVILSYSAIRNFYRKHPDAEDALNNWYRIVEKPIGANFMK